jgi:hypothetical protein
MQTIRNCCWSNVQGGMLSGKRNTNHRQFRLSRWACNRHRLPFSRHRKRKKKRTRIVRWCTRNTCHPSREWWDCPVLEPLAAIMSVNRHLRRLHPKCSNREAVLGTVLESYPRKTRKNFNWTSTWWIVSGTPGTSKRQFHWRRRRWFALRSSLWIHICFPWVRRLKTISLRWSNRTKMMEVQSMTAINRNTNKPNKLAWKMPFVRVLKMPSVTWIRN